MGKNKNVINRGFELYDNKSGIINQEGKCISNVENIATSAEQNLSLMSTINFPSLRERN